MNFKLVNWYIKCFTQSWGQFKCFVELEVHGLAIFSHLLVTSEKSWGSLVVLAEEGLKDEDEGVVAVDVGHTVAIVVVVVGTGGAAVAVDVDRDVLSEGRHVTFPIARTERNK